MSRYLAGIKFAFNLLEEGVKYDKLTNDQIRNSLTEFLNDVNYQQGTCQMFFRYVMRARKIDYCQTIDNVLLELATTDTLSYPPANKARLCRCNAEGVPAFYCSTDSGVPVFEVRPQVGDFVALTTYKNKNDKDTPQTRITIPPIGVRELVKALSDRDENDEMVRILRNFSHFDRNVNPAYLETDKNLTRWFMQPVTNNTHIYRLSLSFYQMFVHNVNFEGEKVKGLIYPSVESDVTGYNIVIEPDLMEENFKFHSSIIYKVEGKVGKEYRLRPLKYSYSISPAPDNTLDNLIEWRDHDMSNEIWPLDPQSTSVFNNGDGTF